MLTSIKTGPLFVYIHSKKRNRLNEDNNAHHPALLGRFSWRSL